MKKFTLFVALICSMSFLKATVYYVQLNTEGAATWDASFSNTGTIVNLATINGGNPASFNAWFADKSLTTPTFAGTKFLSGDQVWVITGTYYLTGTVTLKDGVSIYGGFSGAAGEIIASRTKNSTDKWDFNSPTVFDGSVSGTKTYIGFTGGGSTSTTIIDGVTIQNCTNAATNSSGGGAKISGTVTTMQNCIITSCTTAGTTGTGASAGVSVVSGATLKDSYIHHNTSTSTSTCGGGVAVSGTCTVSGCKIDNNSSQSAAGLYLYGTTSGVSISDCSFSNNSATSNGGAITSYITGTNANPISISNCTFNSNSATNGGALNLVSSTTTNIFNVENCMFTSNTSSAAQSTNFGGGAVMLSTATFSIDKCKFTNNSTSLSYGGALMILSAASCTISNSKFIANTAGSTTTTSGSAIYCKSNYTANNCLFADNTGSTAIHFYSSTAASTFQNCTFANNLTSAGAAAPFQLLALTPGYIFTNCLFYNVSGFSGQTSPTTTTCASDRTLSTISIKTITSADFVDATNATKENRDYSLASGSLAINAGTDLSTATSPIIKDILGNTRPQGGGFDIGAYEYIPNISTNLSKTQSDFLCYSTKNSIEIRYVATNNIVTIYDITGLMLKEVQITSENMSITLPRGIYLVKIGSEVRKVSVN